MCKSISSTMTDEIASAIESAAKSRTSQLLYSVYDCPISVPAAITQPVKKTIPTASTV